ncbi:GNAT family N-acetyltransferase [Citricoccus sp.]|uniref:GNAT family N-acetyltransferase n=1 Tax=Citricoccus sp. TaxID=1978372 RepID=UPI0028BE53FD|nr:GNAT family N-acetyltransferase [Citricoccus sp.]
MTARGHGAAGTRYYVRDAAPADLEAVLSMKARSWREAYGHLRDESFFAAAEATLDRQVEHWRRLMTQGQVLWLAEDSRGRCVGLAAAGPVQDPQDTDLPPVQLHALYVLAEAQGSGVADALLERAIGDGPCLLWVVEDNARAQSFYRRHGFAAVGDPVPMDGPWAGLTERLMVRRGA